MTQNSPDVEIANQGFAAFRQDLNDVLEDITTLHSGDTAPTTTYANQFWYETDTDKLYIRNEDNDAWIEILTLDQANDHLATIGASITLDGTGNVSIDSGDFTVDTNTLHVDSTNNRVGVGTNSPDSVFHLSSGVADFRIGQIAPSSNSAIRISRDDTSVINGNPLGYLEFGGNDSTSGTDTSFAYISGEASGTHAAGDNPTDLTFGTTNDGASTPTEKVRIDQAGNVGVGTSSPTGKMTIYGAGNVALRWGNTSNLGALTYSGSDPIIQSTTGNTLFYQGSSEKLRIDPNGNIFQNNDKTSLERGYKIYGNSNSETYIYGRTNADTSPVFFAEVGGVGRAEIESDGSFHSNVNSYGGFSDQNYKENIELSGSQWDDIKAVQVKKYSWIHDNLDAPNQLGVVAQDLEASGMGGLVTDHTKMVQQDDGTETAALDDDGNPITYKSVKYSIIYMKAVKALQEAMDKIETLEAQNADFETRIAALEAN